MWAKLTLFAKVNRLYRHNAGLWRVSGCVQELLAGPDLIEVWGNCYSMLLFSDMRGYVYATIIPSSNREFNTVG